MKTKARAAVRWRTGAALLGSCLCLAAWLASGWARAMPQVDARTVEDVFRRAAGAYDRGNFERAADLYQELLRAGFTSGEVYYDLGNVYWRMGSLGYALLNYRRAELLMPRDREVRENLRLARSRTQDRLAEAGWRSLLATLAFWDEWLSYRELFAAFLAAQALFWCLLAARRLARAAGLRAAVWIAFAITLALGSTLGARLVSGARAQEAVVIDADLPVTAGPSSSETVVFHLHEGAEVRIAGADPPYMKIRLADGKEGWVAESGIEQVVPEVGASG